MQKLACQYVGCACANSTSKAPDISLLWRPLPLVAPALVCSDSPRMEAGRADSIKESQLENKPDLPPPSHCLLDEDVVEDNEQEPAQRTQFYPPTQWHQPSNKRTWGLRIRTPTRCSSAWDQDQKTPSNPAQGKTRGGRLIREQE